MSSWFLWVKAFHIIAVICWFAGLFYLPRLFVYHAMAKDAISQERFKVMERKLYRAITTPSAAVSIVLGLVMLVGYWPAFMQGSYWMTCKLLLVAILFAYHIQCGRIVRAFAENNNTKSHRYYRFFNEFPVLILVAVVILVVIKPF